MVCLVIRGKEKLNSPHNKLTRMAKTKEMVILSLEYMQNHKLAWAGGSGNGYNHFGKLSGNISITTSPFDRYPTEIYAVGTKGQQQSCPRSILHVDRRTSRATYETGLHNRIQERNGKTQPHQSVFINFNCEQKNPNIQNRNTNFMHIRLTHISTTI